MKVVTALEIGILEKLFMNSRKLKIETVREIAGMIDAGINTRYIALNTGLSWHTIHNLDA